MAKRNSAVVQDAASELAVCATVYNRKVTERTCIRRLLVLAAICPEQVRTNADLKMVDTSDEWIVTRTGIRERHIAAPNETVSTMGFEAATRAIEMAGIEERPDWPDRCGNDFCDARFPERSLSDSKHVGH